MTAINKEPRVVIKFAFAKLTENSVSESGLQNANCVIVC
jgi:hypothetical protein